MPMPHDVMRRKIKDRLTGREPQEKLRILEQALGELPGYFQGPYGELRRWIKDEMTELSIRISVRNQNAFAVKKERDCQLAVVGPPNAGKSSLLRWLTGRQVAIGNYAFTTLKPVAAIYLLRGARVQLVEIPGIIEGAREGRGHGRALLACARNADAALLAIPLGPGALLSARQLWDECADALCHKRLGIVLTKSDQSDDPHSEDLRSGARRAEAVAREIHDLLCQLGAQCVGASCVSAETDAGRESLDELLWKLSGLMRVYAAGQDGAFILPVGSTVRDFAAGIHKSLGAHISHARVTGASARFANQTVGPDHRLADMDTVEVETGRSRVR